MAASCMLFAIFLVVSISLGVRLLALAGSVSDLDQEAQSHSDTPDTPETHDHELDSPMGSP